MDPTSGSYEGSSAKASEIGTVAGIVDGIEKDVGILMTKAYRRADRHKRALAHFKRTNANVDAIVKRSIKRTIAMLEEKAAEEAVPQVIEMLKGIVRVLSKKPAPPAHTAKKDGGASKIVARSAAASKPKRKKRRKDGI